MIANILYDPYRPVPNETLFEEIKRQEIDHKLWEAVTDPQSAPRSINLGHKQIVLHAKLTGQKKICIMEEDVWFPADDGWDYFLANEPANYDLYLGGIYGLNQSAMNRMEGSGTVEIHNFAGLHCYIIHERYYDTFLSIPDHQHIDLGNAGLGKYLVCYPFAALQYPGYSANNRVKVNYNEESAVPKHHIYYGTPENGHIGDQ